MPHRIYQAAQQAQQALQQIQQAAQQLAMQGQHNVNFAGPHSAMQPGFAGTDAQQVRQDISNNTMNMNSGNMGGYTQQAGGFLPQGASFAGSHSAMHSGFSGTDAQQVRQDIANSTMNMNRGNMGGYTQQASSFLPQGASFAGSHSAMHSGFSGTDAQQVRQDIANSNMNMNRGNMGGYTQQPGSFSPQNASFAGSHSAMQPGFSRTDAQQVRQDIANSSMNSGNMGGLIQ
ncbi:hypothetical protein [Ectobacillus funiculus]|uniref:hypothetical protein n=1 Tax=Ectobacillus funiculus TaxID=137993 RepID=UPI00101D74C4|nr:hypothetical protein [Ectobacillus funiculus]